MCSVSTAKMAQAKVEDFRVCIVPPKGEMRIAMSQLMPERSSDPAHKMFYSCLGFRRPPNRCFPKSGVQL